MLSTNVYRALRELLPEPPLLVATVQVNHADGTVTVQYPGGGTQRVRGAGTVGQNVFIRSGVVEGSAPSLTPVTIEE